VHSRTVLLHLGDGTSDHVEQIWRSRSSETWCARIWAIDGGRCAREESDPLKFHEKACAEWAAHVVKSGVGT
jgi:hypothetical protein